MSLTKEADEIRAVVDGMRKRRGRKYSTEFRARVLEWMERALEDGMNMIEMGHAVGIDPKRLDTWQREAYELAATTVPAPVMPLATSSTALVPVQLREATDLPWGPSIAFSVPGGYRIEGLTMDQALALLRLFS